MLGRKKQRKWKQRHPNKQHESYQNDNDIASQLKDMDTIKEYCDIPKGYYKKSKRNFNKEFQKSIEFPKKISKSEK